MSIWDELKQVTRLRRDGDNFTILCPEGDLGKSVFSYGRGMLDVTFTKQGVQSGSILSISSIDDSGATFWSSRIIDTETMLAVLEDNYWKSGLPPFEKVEEQLRPLGFYGELW